MQFLSLSSIIYHFISNIFKIYHVDAFEYTIKIPLKSVTIRKKSKKEDSKDIKVMESSHIYGSPCWARTSDIMINSHALYQLS